MYVLLVLFLLWSKYTLALLTNLSHVGSSEAVEAVVGELVMAENQEQFDTGIRRVQRAYNLSPHQVCVEERVE
jgi:hypothetical protein